MQGYLYDRFLKASWIFGIHDIIVNGSVTPKEGMRTQIFCNCTRFAVFNVRFPRETKCTPKVAWDLETVPAADTKARIANMEYLVERFGSITDICFLFLFCFVLLSCITLLDWFHYFEIINVSESPEKNRSLCNVWVLACRLVSRLVVKFLLPSDTDTEFYCLWSTLKFALRLHKGYQKDNTRHIHNT